jgi:hypothetical protein
MARRPVANCLAAVVQATGSAFDVPAAAATSAAKSLLLLLDALAELEADEAGLS